MRIKAKTKGLAAAGGALLAAGGLTAVLLSATGTGTGTGSDGGPRALSAPEAQRMALTRFRTYRASPSAVTLRAATPSGATVVRAVVDHRRHRAVGAYEAGGARGLLAWDLAGVAVADAPGARAGDVVRAAREVEERAWVRRGYAAGPLDVGLRLVLSLASDRPDNAQLLAQSGPLWLRGERIDGRSYDVFSGPRPRPRGTGGSPSGRSPLAYWIDADGKLRRLTADLGSGRVVTVDLPGGRVVGRFPEGPWEEDERR
ncbi:hypothetical protein [Streptomyces sp. YU58]|uniref:hypothetical protein n=1 Tax=Streptomyces sp. SX92 TaxID=3158972 RepID=UPI0027B87FBC|nr:hypothetical protein [Streptomyces coralus]WLW55064.1 hypothetical protein QU709_28640 [Streptomyces coralus]